MKHIKKFDIIKESSERHFDMISNKDLNDFISQCSLDLKLSKDSFKHEEALKTLKELIKEIQYRINYEEKTNRTSFEQNNYDRIKKIIEDNDEMYYTAEVFKNIKKYAEDVLNGVNTNDNIIFKFNDILNRQQDTNKYYVGYMIKNGKRIYSWMHDGIIKEFTNIKDALIFINELLDNNIPEDDIKIFSPDYMSKMNKIKQQGQ